VIGIMAAMAEELFAIARVISDTADHAAAIDFARFLTTACGPYARALVAGVLALEAP
jgi:hypothetical protein